METPLLTDRPARHLGVGSAIFLNVNRIVGTGIFSVPGSIYASTGSVGWSLVLWVAGALIVLSGFSIYLEYGLEMPRSGGEFNYLSRVYRRPKYLATVAYAMTVFMLEFSATNSYAFGLYLQLVLGVENPSDQLSRYIACISIIIVCFIHTVWPEFGKRAFNVLGFLKLITLVAISLIGVLILSGIWNIPDRPNNFHNIFENDGIGGGVYDYATALLRVTYSYRGWETMNSVLGEIKRPYRTMLVAGPASILLIVVLYFLCNLGYFAVIPKNEIRESGAIIAGRFFTIVFGESVAAKLLPLCVCLSNLGNMLVVSFACARIVKEFGHHHILPFSSTFSSLDPFGTPAVALALHAFTTCIVVLTPPSGEVYEFIVDLSTYPVAIIALSITLGLVYLHRNSEKEHWGVGPHKWHSPWYAIVIFSAANIYMIIAPWIPPATPKQGLPYYAYPLGSVIVIGLSVIYWSIWRKSGKKVLFEAEFAKPDQLII